MASISEVARLAGVSTATASRVVSSADYPVSEQTRARVLDAARELDYVPNALARGLLKRVATRMYFKNGRVKVELALARGRERADKRRVLAERDAQRQMERALKRRR